MGNSLTAGNGLGTTFSYGYNIAARLTTMTSSWVDSAHPGTLLSNVHYAAFGLSGSSLGNGLTESATYNSLGKLASFTAAQSGTTRYSFGLSYAPNGNISSANDSQNGNWSYTYDPFNRLKTASQTGQGFQWDYDRYGNRWRQTVTQGSGGQSSLSFTGSNNHVDGETYDAAGNVTVVAARTYTYDAENRLLTVGEDSTASYVYGADGQRVKTQTYEYLYDLDGNTIAMLNASTGANIYDEIYAGGRHLATYSSSTTSFNHNDWLGTERVRTGPTGTVAETCTNLPFGDGQTCIGFESSFRHFTGDERDTETGLDHTLFRQYQSLEARWLSVDPLGGSIGHPQSLNRDAYVLNNPINSVDPLGLCGFSDALSASNQSIDFSWGSWQNCINAQTFSAMGVFDLPGHNNEMARGLALYLAMVDATIRDANRRSAEKKCDEQRDRFFQNMPIFQSMASQTDSQTNFFVALSAFESGWLDQHNFSLYILFS